MHRLRIEIYGKCALNPDNALSTTLPVSLSSLRGGSVASPTFPVTLEKSAIPGALFSTI